MEENPLYRKVNLYYRVFHPLTTTGLAPCLLLIILNVRICIGLKRLRQSQERRHAQNSMAGALPREGSAQSRNLNEVNMTKIAIVIVVTFVLLNMLRLILCFFEVAQMFTVMKCLGEGLQYQKPIVFNTADNVARLLMVVNSSVNFFIYTFFSKSFQVLMKVFYLKKYNK